MVYFLNASDFYVRACKTFLVLVYVHIFPKSKFISSNCLLILLFRACGHLHVIWIKQVLSLFSKRMGEQNTKAKAINLHLNVLNYFMPVYSHSAPLGIIILSVVKCKNMPLIPKRADLKLLYGLITLSTLEIVHRATKEERYILLYLLLF